MIGQTIFYTSTFQARYVDAHGRSTLLVHSSFSLLAIVIVVDRRIAPSHNNLRHATRILAFTLLNLSVDTLRETNAAHEGMAHLQQLVSWMRDLSVGSREVEEVLMTLVWVWAPVVRCVEFMVCLLLT